MSETSKFIRKVWEDESPWHSSVKTSVLVAGIFFQVWNITKIIDGHVVGGLFWLIVNGVMWVWIAKHPVRPRKKTIDRSSFPERID